MDIELWSISGTRVYKDKIPFDVRKLDLNYALFIVIGLINDNAQELGRNTDLKFDNEKMEEISNAVRGQIVDYVTVDNN